MNVIPERKVSFLKGERHPRKKNVILERMNVIPDLIGDLTSRQSASGSLNKHMINIEKHERYIYSIRSGL